MNNKNNTVIRLRQRLSNRKRNYNSQNINKNEKVDNKKPEDLRKIDELVNFIEGKEKKIENKVKKITKQLEDLKIEINTKGKQKDQKVKVKKEVKIKDLQKGNKKITNSKHNQNSQKKTDSCTKEKAKNKIETQLKQGKNNKKSHSNLEEHESSCTCTCYKKSNLIKEAKLKVQEPILEPPKEKPLKMLTIKRTMEPEPLVTITVKGTTPDDDKLLYTIRNGEIQLVEQEKITKTQQKKNKRIEKENQNEQLITRNNIEIINAEITRKILEQQNICLPPGISLTKIPKPQKSTHTSQSTSLPNKPQSQTIQTKQKNSVIEIETSKLLPVSSTIEENISSQKIKRRQHKKKNMQ